MCLLDQLLEILFIAQAWIDLEEAGRVVAVIGGGGKYRCEPDAIDSEIGKVIQLLDDAGQGTVGL